MAREEINRVKKMKIRWRLWEKAVGNLLAEKGNPTSLFREIILRRSTGNRK
jgi:hypothetical protein